MRDVEKLKVEYVGYENPTTQDEVELEILGLELAVKSAEQRIAHLKQALKVAYIKERSSDKPKNEPGDKSENE